MRFPCASRASSRCSRPCEALLARTELATRILPAITLTGALSTSVPCSSSTRSSYSPACRTVNSTFTRAVRGSAPLSSARTCVGPCSDSVCALAPLGTLSCNRVGAPATAAAAPAVPTISIGDRERARPGRYIGDITSGL
eukprot:scaffold133023_cov32-Tisochrysis_lutea.AAC.5